MQFCGGFGWFSGWITCSNDIILCQNQFKEVLTFDLEKSEKIRNQFGFFSDGYGWIRIFSDGYGFQKGLCEGGC